MSICRLLVRPLFQQLFSLLSGFSLSYGLLDKRQFESVIIEHKVLESFDGFLCTFFGVHLNEAVSTRFTCMFSLVLAPSNHSYLFNFAHLCLFENCFNLFFPSVKIQIFNINLFFLLVSHIVCLYLLFLDNFFFFRWFCHKPLRGKFKVQGRVNVVNFVISEWFQSSPCTWLGFVLRDGQSVEGRN